MNGKRKEQALQAQTDLLATVFESFPNILILVDADGRVEKINRLGSEFANSPQEDLIGLLGGEALHCINTFDGKGCGRNPECRDCPIRTRMMRSLDEGVTILNEEGRLTIRRDAGEVPVNFQISTVPVDIAGDSKVLITIVDITERKLAEEKMRYQAYLLENVSDAIISTDSDFIIQTELEPSGGGIPSSFDFETSRSLGLQLVRLLTTHDLQGSIKLERDNGTQFRIEIPVQTRDEE